MGSFGEVAMDAVDRMREKGTPVGLLKLRLWRPFPFETSAKPCRTGDAGGDGPGDFHRRIGGPVASEMKSALYGQPNVPRSSASSPAGRRDVPPSILKRW